ncbi:MAG TPA: hypothetical protein GYA10_11635, partial [Alphaproteobacteria bacterium]|nr:hypothetical protein [Alphaproteobacteria bacterium]
MLTADPPGEGTNVPLVLPAAQQQALVDFLSPPVAAGKPGAPPAEAIVAIMPQAPEAPLPASAAPPSPKALLAALADQLAALQQALTGDAPLDPTLERKLGET